MTEKRRSPPVYTPIAVSRRARYSLVVLVPVIGLCALPFAVSVSILLVDFFLERLPCPSRGGVNRGVPPDPLFFLFFSACGEPSFRT